MSVSCVRCLLTYRLSIALMGFITLLSLLPIGATSLDKVSFVDKYTHLVMYLSLSLALWIESRVWCARRPCSLLLLCVAFPIALGGVMELLQTWCTTVRSGDWLDFLANSLGVLVAWPLGRALHRAKWPEN